MISLVETSPSALQYLDTRWTKLKPPYPSDLIAFIDFDNPAGPLVPTVGNFTLTNTGTIDIEGYHGRGRKGSGGTNDGLQANQKVLPTGAKSIWIIYKNPVGSRIIGDIRLMNETGMEIGDMSNGALRYTELQGTTTLFSVIAPEFTLINDDCWHTILCAWNGTTGANCAKMWHDGVLVAQATAAGIRTSASNSNMAIFNYSPLSSGSANNFSGALDEIAIFNTAKDISDFKRNIRRRD